MILVIAQERLVGALHERNEFTVVHIAHPKSVDVVRRSTFRCATPAKAANWARAVRNIAANIDINGLFISFIIFVFIYLTSCLAEQLPARRILVLINPYSGRKQAPNVWEKSARPMFDAAGVEYIKKGM